MWKPSIYATPNADGVLPLDDTVNPFYRKALQRFRRDAAEPVLAAETPQLTEEQWDRVVAKLAPHGKWIESKKGAVVEKLGREKLQHYVDGAQADAVRSTLAADKEVARRLAAVNELRKLLLYHRHLLRLVNNFVSFPELYDPARRAVFEMGSLVIDGRWFNFAVKVEDQQAHAKLAKTSGMCVIYVEIMRVDQSDSNVIATPAISGTMGNLCVGKRGVFYDVQGRHHDARIIQIIENPVSFREALVAPFVRIGKFIGGKIEAISGSAQKALESQVGKAAAKVQSGVKEAVRQAPTAPGPVRSGGGSRRDLLLGASVSIAALTSAFAFITSKLADVNRVTILLALGVAILIVFIPTAVVAAFKLHRRDLSAILEGCGWAINARMRLTGRQRRQFTRVEPYPADAKGTPLRPVYRWIVTIVLGITILACGGMVWRASVGPWWRGVMERRADDAEVPAEDDPDAVKPAE